MEEGGEDGWVEVVVVVVGWGGRKVLLPRSCVCFCVLTKHRFNDAESGCHLSSALMATPGTVTTRC